MFILCVALDFMVVSEPMHNGLFLLSRHLPLSDLKCLSGRAQFFSHTAKAKAKVVPRLFLTGKTQRDSVNNKTSSSHVTATDQSAASI
jgi:hypothetical protein